MNDAYESKKKRLFAWVSPEIHNRAKAAAALSNMKLQDWVEKIVNEHIQREYGGFYDRH